MATIGRTELTGTTYYSHSECHPGLTLFAPLCGKEAFLISMAGKLIHKWDLPTTSGGHVELLPNGHLMFAGKVEDGPLAHLEGAAGFLMEMDKDGKIIWEHRDPYHHHTFHRLDNGNTLYPRWVEVPKEMAEQVQGGLPGYGKDGKMWGDAIVEIDGQGNVVWEWIAHERLDPEKDTIWPVCTHAEWTHITAIDLMENGDILLNAMRLSSVLLIDKKSGDVKLRWGKDELSLQNWACVLKGGNILIFDNGWQSYGEGQGFSRVLEFDPKEQKVVWGYEEDPPHFLFSSFLGSCQRLPNENTLLLEGTTGRMMELNNKGVMVWEYINPYRYDHPEYGNNGYVFSAQRYGLDYVGLRKFYGLEKDWIMWQDLESNQQLGKKEPEKKEMTMEERIRSRLEPLGY